MKNIKYFLVVLLALIFNACNDDKFFELQRPAQFPWNSVTELEFAAVSPYNKMFYGSYSPMSTQLYNQVIQSDYFKFAGNVEGWSTGQIYNRRYSDRITEYEGLYSSLYNVIGVCNNGLDIYQTTNDNPFPYASDIDNEKNVKRIKGELLFMRAYAYYYLAINFCPAYGYGSNNDSKILVKRDHVSKSSEDALNNQPSPTSEIYDFIVADLKEAKALLPTDWTEGTHVSYKSRSRANKWAASAFLAQVYFTMHKFTGTESALTELNDVIDNGGYSLTTDPFDCFNNMSTALLPLENKEVILWGFYADAEMFNVKYQYHGVYCYKLFTKCNRDAQYGGGGNTSTGTTPKWSYSDWWQMSLAKNSLVEMGWMNADGSEPLSARWDKRYYNVPTPATANFVNERGLFYRFEGCYKDTTSYRIDKGIPQLGKRTGASDDGKYLISTKYSVLSGGKQLIDPNEPVVLVNKYYRSTQGKSQNIPIIRLAELCLNRAMIKNRAGVAGWAADYNRVASRAWNATLAGTPYVEKKDPEVTERMILVERWKELAGEDSWYIPFCQALGYEIGQGDRPAESNTPDIKVPYADSYWKNCIPLSELDFQKK